MPQGRLYVLDVTSTNATTGLYEWREVRMNMTAADGSGPISSTGVHLPGYDTAVSFNTTDASLGRQELVLVASGPWKAALESKSSTYKQWVGVYSSDTGGAILTALQVCGAEGLGRAKAGGRRACVRPFVLSSVHSFVPACMLVCVCVSAACMYAHVDAFLKLTGTGASLLLPPPPQPNPHALPPPRQNVTVDGLSHIPFKRVAFYINVKKTQYSEANVTIATGDAGGEVRLSMPDDPWVKDASLVIDPDGTRVYMYGGQEPTKVVWGWGFGVWGL